VSDRTVPEILQALRQTLELAQLGRDDYLAGGHRRYPGLTTAVTSGRSVTFVLQNLRGHAEGFDEWYEPERQKLADDPVGRFFVQVRNKIEKQGTAGQLSNTLTLNGTLATAEILKSPPSGAIGRFIGDQLGRSGWTIRLADGTETQVFTATPAAEVIAQRLLLEGAPDDRDLGALLTTWIRQLEALVARAEKRFGDTVH
jgi:hypothetical protein